MGGGDAAAAGAPPAAPVDEPLLPPACMLDLLLPDTIISILKLLADTPASIVAFSLCCSQAQQLCSDRNLWADLCRSLTDALPTQLRSVDWRPSAWGVGSHSELYVRLLHPYRPLLQQRVWHTAKMPPGQLLVVDAQPPCLVGCSVFFKNLQGAPWGYPVFVVELEEDTKGKAQAQCCLCRAGGVDLQLQPLSEAPYVGVLPPVPEAAAAAAAVGGTLTGSDTSSVGGAAAQPPPACLSLCCEQHCGELYGEQLTRCYGRVYPPRMARGRAPGHAAAAAPAGSGGSASPVASAEGSMHSPASSDSGSDGGDGGSNGSSGVEAGPGGSEGVTSSTGQLLPLPEVEDQGQAQVSYWDLHHNMDDRTKYSKEWRSQASYAPFTPSPWLQPHTTSPLEASAGGSGSLDHAGRGSSSAAPQAAGLATSPAAEAAEAMTGLWRGTYGAHGVELVLLQLLQAPAGFDMWQQHRLPQPPPSHVNDCLPGLLLQAVLHTPADAGGQQQQQQQQQQALEDQPQPAAGDGSGSEAAPALPPAGEAEQQQVAPAAAVAEAAGSSGTDHHPQSSMQQLAGEAAASAGGTMPAQQLLLVATKVTGDRNVPAGRVTFAVDLGSKSRAGAGQLLQLPDQVYSPIEVNSPGTRPLVVKERYRGLAQIADTNFKDPKINAVELVVFEDAACFGVLWAPPMHTLSFFVRQPGLP